MKSAGPDINFVIRPGEILPLTPPLPLPPAAERALAEAAERRNAARSASPPEVHGRGGLEPVRYGDWEVKGLASDF